MSLNSKMMAAPVKSSLDGKLLETGTVRCSMRSGW